MERKIAMAALPFFILPCRALCPAGMPAPAAVRGGAVAVVADSVGEPPVDRSVTLGEVVVGGSTGATGVQMRSALNTVGADSRYIEDNFGGSLMQSLSGLPGVRAMSIGSGSSKPMIRGLGFNRVVVAENGMKHEGQQWGDDHGLEADQYAVDRVEVIKGPAALAYGSDAIGGVIDLHSDAPPQSRFGGRLRLFARTNNESVGTSLRVEGRGRRLWYKADATLVSYADYGIPADSIRYHSYYIRLHRRRLRNTAGREADASLAAGFESGPWRAFVRVAAVSTRSGYFANAHGLEVMLSDIDYDSSRRDIDLPSQTALHLSATARAGRSWAGGGAEACLGWQANSRRERSEPVSHGYMPKPPGTLERSFDKHTLTATATVRQQVGMCAVRAGAAIERQVNRRGGWGFILPDFEQLGFGAFVAGRLVLGTDLILSAGVRFDCGSVGIHSYRDWYKTPVDGSDSVFMERSAGLNRWFSAVTWSVGVNRRLGRLVLKANAGKGFRMPIAKELGTDGVNYSIFRYERGNASLAPEVSYQADAGVVYAHRGVDASLTPYVNYFPNYICLNPTPEYLEGLQLYRYTQGRVLRWGGEASLSWRLVDWLELGAGGEYLWASQLSGDKKGYTLPFSAPWRVSCGLRFMWAGGRRAGRGHASAEFVAVGAQRRVVPPEEPTAGHCLVNVAVGQAVAVASHSLHITLRCDNLLGSRYYDHTSYYRLIGVPEPGRSFALMASWAL